MEKVRIPVYEMKIYPEAVSATGVTCVSLVNSPAIESNFVALSAQDAADLKTISASAFNAARKDVAKLATVTDAPRGEVTGPLLIPDFQIYRLDEQGNPFFITFSADTIREIALKFSKGKWHNSTNEEHSIPLGGNTMMELWIVEDPEKDKAAALGLSVPKGTWMGTMKIEDREYFDAEILSGNRRGFSIEGWFEYAEALAAHKMSTQKLYKMSQKPNTGTGFLSKLKAIILGAESEAEAKVKAALANEGKSFKGAAYTVEDGTMSIIVVDETKEAFYKTADDTLGEAVEDGDYILDDGRTLVITDGKESEIKDAEVVAEATDPATTPAVETDAATVAAKSVLASKLGITVDKLNDAIKLSGVGVIGKGSIVKFAAQKLAKTADKANLSIVVDTATSKPIYVDQNSGRCYYIEDYGGWLYTSDAVEAGTYTLLDGSSLVVVSRTEIVYPGETYEYSYTESYVDAEASTTDVTVLVPWLKNATSEITELATLASTKLASATTELETVKAEVKKLTAQLTAIKAKPAAPAAVIPPVTALASKFGPGAKAQALAAKMASTVEKV